MLHPNELKAWLVGRHERAVSPEELVAPLGVHPEELSGPGQDALRFAVAALRDVYLDDIDVWLWFRRACPDLGPVKPVDLLTSGRLEELESLVAHAWTAANATTLGDTATVG